MSNEVSSSVLSKNEVKLDHPFDRRPFERIFGNAVARIVDFFIIYREFDYSESDIAKRTRLSPKTVSNELEILLKEGIIKLTRKSGRSNMYKLGDSKKVRGLIQYMADTNDIVFEDISKNP